MGSWLIARGHATSRLRAARLSGERRVGRRTAAERRQRSQRQVLPASSGWATVSRCAIPPKVSALRAQADAGRLLQPRGGRLIYLGARAIALVVATVAALVLTPAGDDAKGGSVLALVRSPSCSPLVAVLGPDQSC